MSDSWRPLWTAASQAIPSMVFSRQEYWSGLAISFSRGIFLTQGSTPGLLHCTLYPLSHQGELDHSALFKQSSQSSLVAQMVNNLPATQETWDWSLGQKDPPEKGMAAQSSILAWTTPWTEEPGRLPSMGSQRVGQDWAGNTLKY